MIWRPVTESNSARRIWSSLRSRSPGRKKLAESRSLEDHALASTHSFRGRSRPLAGSPSRFGGCGRSRTCTAVTPSRGSSPISTPMRASGIGGERTIRKPCRCQHPATSHRVRRPGRFTLQDWSPTRDLRSDLPGTGRLHLLFMLAGQFGPACRELHGRHSR